MFVKTKNGPTQIVGDTMASDVVQHLVDKHEAVTDCLFPSEQQEQYKEFRKWHKRTMRKVSALLIEQALAKETDKAELEAYKNILKEGIESRLSDESKFLTGEKISVADVMIYCEISTIDKLFIREEKTAGRQSVVNDLQQMSKWYKEMSKIFEIENTNVHLDIIIAKQKLLP